MNRIIIEGSLSDTPVLQTTESGKTYLHLHVKTVEEYDGRTYGTEYHSFTLWDKHARDVADLQLQEGQILHLEGYLHNWRSGEEGAYTYHLEPRVTRLTLVKSQETVQS